MLLKNKRRNVDDIQNLKQILNVKHDIKKIFVKSRRFFLNYFDFVRENSITISSSKNYNVVESCNTKH